MTMRMLIRSVAMVVLTVTLTACETPEPGAEVPPRAGPLVLTGELSARQRVTLPEGSVVRVELTETGNNGARVLAASRAPLDGQSLPFAFELVVEADQLDPLEEYLLSSAVLVDDTVIWSSEPLTILPASGRHDIGTVWLQAVSVMPATEAASAPVLRATGNEPPWLLVIDETTLELTLEYGQRVLEAPAPATEETPEGGRRWRQALEGMTLEAVAREEICRDTMTGMPHPLSVALVLDGEPFAGCGGEPRSLLLGESWQVETIAGAAPVEDAEVSLQFAADGRLAGSGPCNRYTGPYSLSGEGLGIGDLASTMMACTPARMDQEETFHSLLRAVYRFDIDASGALVLHAPDGRTLIARR